MVFGGVEKKGGVKYGSSRKCEMGGREVSGMFGVVEVVERNSSADECFSGVM